MMRCAFVMGFVILAASLSGCSSKTKWLQGKWIVDVKYTQDKMNAGQSKKHGLAGLGQAIVIKAMKDVTMEFSGNECRSQKGNGKSQVHTFKVIDSPDANTLVLKSEDGKVTNWHREGDRIATSTDGVEMKIYFKRAD